MNNPVSYACFCPPGLRALRAPAPGAGLRQFAPEVPGQRGGLQREATAAAAASAAGADRGHGQPGQPLQPGRVLLELLLLVT